MGALRLQADRTIRAPSTACIDDALERIGAYASDFDWPDLRLMAGEHRIVGAARDGLGGGCLATSDLDELKAWVGYADADVRRGALIPTRQEPQGSPDRPAPDDARRAMSAWLYGDSARWAPWRPIIERTCAPFLLDVVTLSTLRLPRGSRLEFGGGLILFMARRIVFEGGGLVSAADGCYAIGEVDTSRAAP